VFIRKKRNKSGSYSFHIVRKEGRRQVLVRTVGTAATPERVDALALVAKQILAEITQQQAMNFVFDQDEKFITQLKDNIQSIRIAGADLILGKLFHDAFSIQAFCAFCRLTKQCLFSS